MAGAAGGAMSMETAHATANSMFSRAPADARRLAEETLSRGAIAEAYEASGPLQQARKLTGHEVTQIFREKVRQLAGLAETAGQVARLELMVLSLSVEVLRRC
mmetsp:Transcript_18799/g.58044  ORF Transcript_18799/g.58044 Transcript_18799/m.58044 type:complete len:103 (+) Transcript_18799:469-777(+)